LNKDAQRFARLGGALETVRPARQVHLARAMKGAATSIFFVHGAGGNKEQWRFQWAHFADAPVNLVAWDAIGHGASPRPRAASAYQGQELLEDAEAIFLKYKTARNIVVAHSYGARLALAWLLAHPGAFDSAVLLGAAPLGQLGGRLFPGWLGRVPLPIMELARPILSRAFRKRAWSADADPALVATEQRATRGNTLFMMQSLIAGAPAIDTAALRGITQPITILAGEQDGLIPPDSSSRLAEYLPNATLLTVPACGHQIMLEAPGITNQAIDAALGHAAGAPA
jgi:pimeloyl-ACP methyl ester carboxylesterase